MKKYEIIKKNTDFDDIIGNGSKLKNKLFSIYYKDSNYEYPTFGLAVSKKCGNAVERNKIKRQLRMIITNNKDIFQNKAYIIIPRVIIKEQSYKYIEDSLVSLMERNKDEK